MHDVCLYTQLQMLTTKGRFGSCGLFFVDFFRFSLKDVYESVLLEDLVAAVEKSVDDRLWRYVFYAPVEELRAELRKVG
jgi:hypothetical protein